MQKILIMNISALYIEWMRYLKNKKLFGAWMKDVSKYESMLRTPLFSDFSYKSKSFYFFDEIDMVKNFNCKTNARYLVKHLADIVKFGIFNIFSPIKWEQEYELFINIKHNPLLSSKLSRKLSRANGKRSNCLKTSKREEQPWYNKSYEKINRIRYEINR